MAAPLQVHGDHQEPLGLLTGSNATGGAHTAACRGRSCKPSPTCSAQGPGGMLGCHMAITYGLDTCVLTPPVERAVGPTIQAEPHMQRSGARLDDKLSHGHCPGGSLVPYSKSWGQSVTRTCFSACLPDAVCCNAAPQRTHPTLLACPSSRPLVSVLAVH